jgi:succinyl-CoA synthetase beta subunit/ferredoxin-like protein FixX
VLLFSESGGSGVEERSADLTRLSFSLSDPPEEERIASEIPLPNVTGLAPFLAGMVRAFCANRLLVLEVNPLGVTEDGEAVAIDCRAEFERRAVRKADAELFDAPAPGAESALTEREDLVGRINAADPSGTGFFREARTEDGIPEGAVRVATNLCGGGGKMLWEMATGGREDIFALNESDTSGGLSAFKSYRILRVIISMEQAQALVLTGSGMAFQNQFSIAAAVWKALRESPSSPPPCLLRFGGTDEDRAMELFERVGSDLRAEVRVYPPEIFPNAMVDDIPEIAALGRTKTSPAALPDAPVAFSVDTPPGVFRIDASKCLECEKRPCLEACPTSFLTWSTDAVVRSEADGARCIGCLLCEAVCLLEGGGGMFIELSPTGEV